MSLRSYGKYTHAIHFHQLPRIEAVIEFCYVSLSIAGLGWWRLQRCKQRTAFVGDRRTRHGNAPSVFFAPHRVRSRHHPHYANAEVFPCREIKRNRDPGVIYYYERHADAKARRRRKAEKAALSSSKIALPWSSTSRTSSLSVSRLTRSPVGCACPDIGTRVSKRTVYIPNLLYFDESCRRDCEMAAFN